MRYQYRVFIIALALLLLTGTTVFADQAPTAANPFGTSAKFSVDATAPTLSSVVATIEPRADAPGYSWLRLHFYSFPPAADDMAAIEAGDVATLEKKREKLPQSDYNLSTATLQFSVDKDFKVWQVDMSIPGQACTIAPYEKDVAKFLQSYKFDGKTLALKSKGTYACDMKFMKLPDAMYNWDLDLNVPVYAKK